MAVIHQIAERLKWNVDEAEGPGRWRQPTDNGMRLEEEEEEEWVNCNERRKKNSKKNFGVYNALCFNCDTGMTAGARMLC